MSGYVKIYGSILGSSIWAESVPTRIVWITMLAMADEHGKVEASHSGLARFANVSLSQCRAALTALSSPDKDSRTPDNDGRRVEKVEGGWLILNYRKYREMRSQKQVAEAERKARWREGQRDERDMSPVSPEIRATVAEAASVAVKASTSSARAELLRVVPNPDSWDAVMNGALQGLDGPLLTAEQVERACRDYLANGESKQPTMRLFRAYLANAAVPSKQNAKKAGDAALVFGQIRALIQTSQAPGQAEKRFIPRAKVQALGPDVFQAYEAIGGADRVLAPDAGGFVLRDFTQALEAARAQS